jgi:hypothetical protein
MTKVACHPLLRGAAHRPALPNTPAPVQDLVAAREGVWRCACAVRSSQPRPCPARPHTTMPAGAPSLSRSLPCTLQDRMTARQDVRRCDAALALRAATHRTCVLTNSLAHQLAHCAVCSALPHRRSRRRASRTSWQHGATCCAAAWPSRCAQQPAAPAPRAPPARTPARPLRRAPRSGAAPRKPRGFMPLW